jgi:glycosyltransferase involved in cell wall biosynthesis
MQEERRSAYAAGHPPGPRQAVLPWQAERAHGAPERRCVVFVGPSAGALAVTMGSAIQEIASRRHDVICFAPSLNPEAERNFSRLGAEARPLPAFSQGFSPVADPRSVYRLAHSFRDIEPHIVAGFSPKAAVLAAMAGRLAKVDRVITVLSELGRGFAETPGKAAPTAKRFQSMLMRLAFRLSDTAIFFNEENYKLLQRQKLVPGKLRQFPLPGSGVDLRQFPDTALPPLERGVMFLFAGPLDRRLGVQEYCEAARLLRAKSGNYRCLLAGPEMRGAHGFPLERLKRYRDCVQYLGPQPDPRSLIARTHVFVMPASSDAVPNALVEAMAMGRPVITTTSRGCRVAVGAHGNGLLVPPGDPSALAGAMTRLLLRPDLIVSMARASRALAESRFDSRRINAQLMAALGL